MSTSIVVWQTVANPAPKHKLPRRKALGTHCWVSKPGQKSLFVTLWAVGARRCTLYVTSKALAEAVLLKDFDSPDDLIRFVQLEHKNGTLHTLISEKFSPKTFPSKVCPKFERPAYPCNYEHLEGLGDQTLKVSKFETLPCTHTREVRLTPTQASGLAARFSCHGMGPDSRRVALLPYPNFERTCLKLSSAKFAKVTSQAFCSQGFQVVRWLWAQTFKLSLRKFHSPNFVGAY